MSRLFLGLALCLLALVVAPSDSEATPGIPGEAVESCGANCTVDDPDVDCWTLGHWWFNSCNEESDFCDGN